ncbi:MAG TPA: NADH-quinone oxidoreductase subunit C [Bacteroidales bacterium]|jgi:NADH-quinone oxidoreductase subunit C|nr:NADH-quinone oxidoreductase subunit C [Bacteroidales bacterium]
MTQINVIQKITDIFGASVLDVSVRTARRVIMTIDHKALPAIAEYVYLTAGFRFIIASALHTKKGFEIHYHFSLDSEGLILNLHVILDKVKPEVESLSNMFNASNWIEREMHELFGINFLHHPNQEKLISEGNWAEGVYPMRKDLN